MELSTTDTRIVPLPTSGDVLTEILRRGSVELLAKAVEAEVADWLEQHRQHRDAQGRQQVVRNGHAPQRSILTGLGPIPVRPPRVRDRRPADQAEKFTSRILPPYLRKAKAVEDLLPWLYLKGISTDDFNEALASLLGPQVKGLSASTITRLKEVWREEYQAWNRRSLEGKRYVYVWADGVHFNIRLEDDRQCILVLMGATAEGTKELIAISDGYRESEHSWRALLLDCQARGLTSAPELAIADGALGFWKALPQVWPKTREQRCWVHKTANVLDKLPKGQQSKAKAMIHEIWMAASRAEADQAFDLFVSTWKIKYPKATECLAKDREELLVFYDFPAEHWIHLRTTNPIESVLATVRLRTCKTKGCGSRIACETMVFKLMQSASKKWRRLNGAELLPEVLRGVKFVDGIRSTENAA